MHQRFDVTENLEKFGKMKQGHSDRQTTHRHQASALAHSRLALALSFPARLLIVSACMCVHDVVNLPASLSPHTHSCQGPGGRQRKLPETCTWTIWIPFF